jgi:hypothetical protein
VILVYLWCGTRPVLLTQFDSAWQGPAWPQSTRCARHVDQHANRQHRTHYKEITMTLQNKLQRCFRAQGHEKTNSIFTGINALMLKHFTIGLLLKL